MTRRKTSIKILVAQNKEKNSDGNDVDDTSSRMMGHTMELAQSVNDMGDKIKHKQMQISALQIDNQLLHTQLTVDGSAALHFVILIYVPTCLVLWY